MKRTAITALTIIALLFLGALSPVLAQTGANSLPPTGPKPMVVPEWATNVNGLPSLDAAAPGAPHYLVTSNGQCAWWWVYTDTGQRMRVYCGTVADLANVGGRMNTIRGAADPAKSLDDLGKRITLRPIACAGLVCSTTYAPLQPIIADLNAALAR